MKVHVRLDTMSDIQKFVEIVSQVDEDVSLEDENGYRVSAKSILGVTYSKMEWKTIYCVCDKDIAGLIVSWIV